MTSILEPAVPAGAYDEFLPGALASARAQRYMIGFSKRSFQTTAT